MLNVTRARSEDHADRKFYERDPQNLGLLREEQEKKVTVPDDPTILKRINR